MYILGIHDRHNATASLLKDGQIIAAASEERFTRLKNQSGFPFLAVKYCLESAMIKGKDVNLTVFANNSPFSLAASIISARVLQNKAPSQNVKLAKALYYHLHSLILSAEYRLLQTKPASIIRNNPAYKFLFRFFEKKGYQAIGQITGLNIRKMREIDHHLAHACSAIYASPFPALKKKTLIFTCDGSGDGLSATISLYTNGKIKNLSLTPAINSLGNFYAYITAFLGMKPLEHEYKVMGLAPYSPDFGKNLAYQILKPLIWLDKKTLTFRTKFSSELFGLYFQKTLPQIRFDFVASASQQITEELLTAWVKEAIKKYRIRSIACSGGVFMNVKVNQKIAELPEVKDSFFMPSGGDESNALGAAYWGYRYVAKKIPRPLTNLYLGPSYSQTEIKNAFKQNKIHGRIKINLDIEKTIASLLAKGEIVARLNGRMEWGARALGNRSILADASRPGVTETLNKMIKSRDFWMPFAPVIMKEYQNEYLVNPKKIEAPFMIITFDSTPRAHQDLRAAMHPYDKTLRPQVIDRTTNPSLYKILKEYRKLTGKSGLLNTSFNIHGDPIVCSPEDALKTFEKTGLKYLAMGNFLISKN